MTDTPSRTVYKDTGVTITNSTGIGRHTNVSIGGISIPVYKATITIEPDEFVQVQLLVRANSVDLQALASQTQVQVIDGGEDGLPEGDDL